MNKTRIPGPCQDLTGMDFSSQDLHDVDFSGSNLAGTTFANANLSHANLSRTSLDGVNFANANLKHARFPRTRILFGSFSGAQMPNLYDVEFYRSDLTNAQFTNAKCTLVGVRFVLTETRGLRIENCETINDVQFISNHNGGVVGNQASLILKNSVVYGLSFIDSTFPYAQISGVQTKCPYDIHTVKNCRDPIFEVFGRSETFKGLKVDLQSSKAIGLSKIHRR